MTLKIDRDKNRFRDIVRGMNATSNERSPGRRTGRTSRLAGVGLTAAVLAVVGGGLAAIAWASEPYGLAMSAGAPPLSVLVEPAELRAGYTVAREFIGTVEARRESRVGFEIGGQVSAVLFDEGDLVERGDVMRIIHNGMEKLPTLM